MDNNTLTDRAIAASVSVASAHGISVENPYILADAYSIKIHLRPDPIVARVSTLTPLLRFPIEPWLEREISVAKFLSTKGAPVVAPSDLLPQIVHHYDGLAMTFWQYVRPVSDIVVQSGEIAKMLAELHVVLRDYPGELPLLAPPLNDIPRGLERLRLLENILTEKDIILLQETYNLLISKLDNHIDSLQPLHGDAHKLNLISTAKGLLWNDFEDTCMGSIIWDLINLSDEEINAYPLNIEPEIIKLYRQIREIHGITWVLALSPEFSNYVKQVKVMFDNWRSRHSLVE